MKKFTANGKKLFIDNIEVDTTLEDLAVTLNIFWDAMAKAMIAKDRRIAELEENLADSESLANSEFSARKELEEIIEALRRDHPSIMATYE